MTFSISVVVPVYNEEKLIKNFISKVDSFLKVNFKDYEIIIIESGSTDRTAFFADELQQEYENVKVFNQKRREGFGSALKLGFSKSQKDILWLLTVDLPYYLNHIMKATKLLEEYDCVLSYRAKDNRSMFRKIQSYMYNFLVKRLLGLRMKQVNSGFKVYKKKVIKEMRVVSNGWFIDTEILYRINRKNISYIEIPVELVENAGRVSSVKPLTFLSTLREVINFYYSEVKTLRSS